MSGCYRKISFCVVNGYCVIINSFDTLDGYLNPCTESGRHEKFTIFVSLHSTSVYILLATCCHSLCITKSRDWGHIKAK